MIARMLAGVVIALLIGFAAHAQDAATSSRLDDVIKHGTLGVGMTGDYMPFTYLDKSTQKYQGFDVDMAEALGKALGVRIDFSEKGYWLQRDVALKAFVDQWLHISMEDGSFNKIYGAWFD